MSTVEYPGPTRPMIGALLRRASEATHRELFDRLQAAGFDDLRWAHFALFGFPGLHGLRPTELAERVGMSKQGLNALIERARRLRLPHETGGGPDGRQRCRAHPEGSRVCRRHEADPRRDRGRDRRPHRVTRPCPTEGHDRRDSRRCFRPWNLIGSANGADLVNHYVLPRSPPGGGSLARARGSWTPRPRLRRWSDRTRIRSRTTRRTTPRSEEVFARCSGLCGEDRPPPGTPLSCCSPWCFVARWSRR